MLSQKKNKNFKIQKQPLTGFIKNVVLKTFKTLKKSSKWEFFFNKIAAQLPTSFKYPEFTYLDFACNFAKKDRLLS